MLAPTSPVRYSFMGKMSKAKAKALVTGETVDLWIWNA